MSRAKGANRERTGCVRGACCALLLLWALPAAGQAPSVEPEDAAAGDPLDAAITCYEQLDYVCADQRLAEALASELAGPRRAQAHLYEALLALAWRDRIRARRAVRALLAIDPAYDPGQVPPPLAKLFDEERPDPPPPPALMLRLDGGAWPVFGQDATQWTYGLGGELSGGVLLDRTWAFEVNLSYADFGPQVFTLEGLTLLHGTLGAGWRGELGPIVMQAGVALGAAYIAVDGVLVDDGYWAVAASAPIDISWPVWRGLALGARFAPLLLSTTTGDTAAASYILPVTVGLRYVQPPD